MLPTELVRRLGSSRFNYWFGYIANVTLVAWLFSHALAHGTLQISFGHLATLVASGFLLWTLLEYLLHRFIYHVIPSPLSVGHDLHHHRPRELIGVPWWLTSLLVVALFTGLAKTFQPASLGVLMSATWLGYICYCILHHASHHWRLGSGYLRKMKQHHLLHHAHPQYNWGFTTALWDRIFGTYLKSSRPQKYRRDKSATARALSRAQFD